MKTTLTNRIDNRKKQPLSKNKTVCFSASKIKIAAMCPRAFILSSYLKRRPFQFRGSGIGQFVHSCLKEALELFQTETTNLKSFKQDTEDQEYSCIQAFIRKTVYQVFYNRIPKLLETSKRQEFLEFAWSTLSKFIDFFADFVLDLASHDQPIDISQIFLGQEWSFTVELVDKYGKTVGLSGRIDLALYNPIRKKLMLWDFKTYNTNKLDIDLLQLATYYIGIKKKLGIKPWLSLLYCSEQHIREEEFTSHQMELFQPQFTTFIYKMLAWHQGQTIPPRAIEVEYCDICTLEKECQSYYPVQDDSTCIKAFF